MASAKDTFEPKTFGANTFACGVWRGIGVTVGTPTAFGRLPSRKRHGRLPARKTHGRLQRR